MSELDTRFMDRRPPPDLVFGATLAHGHGRDLSKNANNATLGPSAALVQDGTAVYLNVDGNKHLVAANVAAYSGSAWDKWSLCAWVYQTSNNPPSYNYFLSRAWTYTWSRSFAFATKGTGQLYGLKSYTNGEQSNKVDTAAFSASTWTFLALTFDETIALQVNRFKFYVNGTFVTSAIQYGSGAATDFVGSANIYIGATSYNGGVDLGFRGRITNPLIWENRILTAAEILAIYNGGRN